MKYREINSFLSRRTLDCLGQQLPWSSIDEENILTLMKWVHWVKNRDTDKSLLIHNRSKLAALSHI